MKNYFNKKTAILTLTILTSSIVMAQSAPAQGTTPPLIIPQYNNSDLASAGCDPQVWSQMVSDYTNKRNLERNQQAEMQVKAQMRAAKPVGSTSGGRSCFEGAIGQINGAISTVNQAIAIFTGGGVDWNALGNNAMNQLTNAACNQLEAYAGNMIYNTTAPLTGALGTITGTINNAGINTPIGNVNVGGAIQQGATNTIPYINQGAVGGALGGTQQVPWYQQYNPFR